MSLFSDSPIGVILAVAAVLLLAILFSSIKKIVKFVLHALLGMALLYVFNSFGGGWGLYLPMDLGSCLTAGFLGLPGVILLLVWHYLL